jgi:hypothetical protein
VNKNEFKTERQIGEYTIILPSPPSEKDIFNYGLPKQLQKFPLIRPPKDFWSWETKDQTEFIRMQWHYRENGLWFFNGGNIEYITGDHWFYLTHWHLDTGLPKFIDADRDWFYITDFAEKNPKAFGTITIENRRSGKTFRATSKVYNKISKTKNVNGGIQSKTNEDAKAVFNKLVYGWRKMEDYFKPMDIGVYPPKSSLVFDAPSQKSTKVRLRETKAALNSYIDFNNVKAEAYDGLKLFYYFNDEYGKNVEEDVNKTQKITRECCMEEGEIRGKQLFSSTIEEMSAKGGENGKRLWDGSAPVNDKNAVYISKTGLIRYFKPCYYGYLGKDDATGERFVDEFGYSKIELCKAYFERKRNMYKDDIVGFREEVQKYPFTIDEAFYVINNDSQLNLFNIQDQITFNEANKSLYVYGDLDWIDNIKDNPLGVRWVPNPNGRWCVSKMPTTPNQIIIKNGKMTPNNGVDGANGMIGIDPISGVKAFSKRKSDLGMFGWNFMNAQDAVSDVPCFDYVARTPNPYDGFEDVIKTCIFFGFKAHIERNKEALITHMEMRGYENYMQRRPSFSISEHSENKKDNGYGTPNSSPSWRNTLFTAAKGVIETCCGFQDVGNENGVKQMAKFYLSRTLKTLQEFKPSEDWNDFDLAVAFMYCIVMRHQYVAQKVEKKQIVLQFKKYAIVNGKSKQIGR